MTFGVIGSLLTKVATFYRYIFIVTGSKSKQNFTLFTISRLFQIIWILNLMNPPQTELNVRLIIKLLRLIEIQERTFFSCLLHLNEMVFLTSLPCDKIENKHIRNEYPGLVEKISRLNTILLTLNSNFQS